MDITHPPILPSDVAGQYAARGLDALSDVRLIGAVADVVATPRRDPADSFVLHAPLELAARAALLPWIDPARRDRARLRLVAIAAEYEAFGPPPPAPVPAEFDTLATAAARLVEAIDRGELDDADGAASWLGRHARPDELRSLLADDLIPRLGAAAHAPIFLYLLPRVGPRGELRGDLLRGLVRELGREPSARLRWIDAPRERHGGSAAALADALRAVPAVDEPASFFIEPVMASVDGTGVAMQVLARALPELTIDEAAPIILRTAAWAMLSEPTVHAAYGWSHCLTMPQGVLGVAHAYTDPARAIAVAATFVVGFRATMGRRPLLSSPPRHQPPMPWREALAVDPEVAAAAVWHAPDAALPHVTTELATRASLHRDAHLVKYTLACLDATAYDPSQRRLYLAAAAALGAWWAQQAADASDPLAV
ncbi:MAG TPA: hypothetical protein VGR62_13790 [Candidatus Binatia bacterium]|jgi:hypothetical protein|nr:hypothetical protein [Candidatus Binatia bacterium]